MRRTSILVAALVLAPLTTLAQNDSVTVARVLLTADGVEVASFSELGGIVAEVKTLEFFDGSTERRGHVTLARPASSNLDLRTWHEAALASGVTGRKSLSLFGYNRRGELILRYQLERAWPARVEISPQKAGSSGAR